MFTFCAIGHDGRFIKKSYEVHTAAVATKRFVPEERTLHFIVI
jgi:hypothetical protein